MVYRKKATDEELIESYSRTKSVWKTADEFGMCGQSVHERLQKLGATIPQNTFTDEEYQILRECYVVYRDAGRLQDLADEMGRSKTMICAKARKLGLTDRNCKRTYLHVWKNAPESVCRPIFDKLKKSRLSVKEFCRKYNYGQSGLERRMKELFPQEWLNMAEKKRGRGRLYKKGRDFEYRVKRHMEKLGYTVVRSYASKTPADLTAVKNGRAVFVQCKLHDFYNVDEWNKYIDYCDNAGALPIYATRSRDGSGIDYFIITGKKDGSRKKQPMKPYDIENMKVFEGEE